MDETQSLEAALRASRPFVLRHCYRMVGSLADAEELTQDTLERAWRSRAQYRGDAPIERWLATIATHTCLNALEQRKRRSLPQLEGAAAGERWTLEALEDAAWLTPVPDAVLFPDAAQASETRESVALAFVALLQRLPPRQRAAVLLKDVLGWSAEDIARALELTVPSVNSALHRARESLASAGPPATEPPPAVLHDFLRAWETRDLDALVALLHRDVQLAMPPRTAWFDGLDAVVRFFQSAPFDDFWRHLVRVTATRANGRPAFLFFRDVDGVVQPWALMVADFHDGRALRLTVFVAPRAFSEFVTPTAQFREAPLS